MKVSDIYKYLNLLKLDKLNLVEGKIRIQKYKNRNLPEVLKIELDKFDDKHISFQPTESITKIEIYLFFEYTDVINNLSEDVYYNFSYINQVRVKIKLISNKGKNKYFFFRIDTHSGKSTFYHPLYHIQINDKKFEDTEEYGDIIFIDTPRFFIHPIDLFLVIDFILHNFSPKSREKLLKDKDKYLPIVKDLQKHFWKPFFEKIYNYLNGEKGSKEEAQKFLPSLI